MYYTTVITTDRIKSLHMLFKSDLESSTKELERTKELNSLAQSVNESFENVIRNFEMYEQLKIRK